MTNILLVCVYIFLTQLSKLHESRVSAEAEEEYTNSAFRQGTAIATESTNTTILDSKITSLDKELTATKTSLKEVNFSSAASSILSFTLLCLCLLLPYSS